MLTALESDSAPLRHADRSSFQKDSSSWQRRPAARMKEPIGERCLELQLERKLELTRRARIRRWEARASDLSNCGCRNSAGKRDNTGHETYEARLPEVWMIEKVKGVCPELQVQALGEFGVFHNRKIHVGETRADESVPAEVADSAWSRQAENRSGIG